MRWALLIRRRLSKPVANTVAIEAIAFIIALSIVATATTRADILYVTNVDGSTIERFTANGTGSLFATSTLGAPQGAAFDAAGNLYVTHPFDNGSNSIEKFTPTGASSVFADNSHLNVPRSIAFDGSGNLYAMNQGNGVIEKFNPDGVASTFATAVPSSFGIAFDRDGNVYVSGLGSNTIEKFPAGGGAGSAFATHGLNQPVGLAFDSAGNLYAANAGNHTIEKFTPGGVGSLFATVPPPPTGTSVDLSGIAFDSAGNLYVADWDEVNKLSAIEMFTPGGVASVFATSGMMAPTGLAFTDDSGVPLTVPPVPEPASLCLLGVASALGLGRQHRVKS